MMNLPNHVIGFPFPLAHLVHEWVESCGYSHLGQPLTYPLVHTLPSCWASAALRWRDWCLFWPTESLRSFLSFSEAGYPAMSICTYVSLAYMGHTFESHHPSVLALRGVRETPPFWLASLTPIPNPAQAYPRFSVTIC